MKIILASTSYIRKQMLSEAGVEFTTAAPLCDEDAIKAEHPGVALSDMALILAKAKAKEISEQNMEAYVIGSDQICEFEGRSISKSKDRQGAFDSLRNLAGNTHYQNNGTCVFLGGECVYEFKDKAILTMKPMSDAEIWEYIEKDDPVGCAGSYKFELNGKYLFEKIDGNEECIKGFGLTKVVEFLQKSFK